VVPGASPARVSARAREVGVGQVKRGGDRQVLGVHESQPALVGTGGGQREGLAPGGPRRRPGLQAEHGKRGMAVSEQVSGTRGRVRDEAIKRQDRAEAREYAGEWPEPEEEPAGETEREAIWAPAARLAGSPTPEDWQAVELRSDLARHLDRTAWPVTRERLLQILTERQAGDRLLAVATALPQRQRYHSLGELARALGLEPEQRG
jgi:hypothetical protein